MWEILKADVREAHARRVWASLPMHFELGAVRRLAESFKPYLKGLIAGRIAVNRATSFVDLLDAVDQAEKEDKRKISRA